MPALVLAAATLAPVAAASSTWSAPGFVRSDDRGRVQIVVDRPGSDSYLALLFQPGAPLPLLAPRTIDAIVVVGDDRVTVDASDASLHLDLYTRTDGEPPVTVGDERALRANGLALRQFRIPKRSTRMENIRLDGTTLVGSARPALITCKGGRVWKDTECAFGGPGAAKGPSFSCSTMHAKTPVMGFDGDPSNAGELTCGAGYYPCGGCTATYQAFQECRPYDDCGPTVGGPPSVPPPDPGPR